MIMADHTMTSTPGTQNKVTAESLQAFSAGLRGSLITPDSPDYDKARTIWNATVDKRPDMIVRCAGTADVMHAVKFARENSLLVAIKGAGHNIAGNAVCNGGMVIDLSAMK